MRKTHSVSSANMVGLLYLSHSINLSINTNFNFKALFTIYSFLLQLITLYIYACLYVHLHPPSPFPSNSSENTSLPSSQQKKWYPVVVRASFPAACVFSFLDLCRWFLFTHKLPPRSIILM